jgi:hypothetical protein
VKTRLGILARTLARVPTGLWIVVLTLPALIPLGQGGFFESHDGLFHLYRLAALDRAVRAGVLYPRWFPEFAFGYGHPVLNFYGPLSYYWGLPFTLLGADTVLAMKLVLATGLVAAAWGMYLFARLHLDRGPAVVAAVVYTYLPYHLADLYVRGAVAEFLAFVWFPLSLWTFHRLIRDSEQRGLTWLAAAVLSVVALVVTHNLSTLIFAPVLAGYVVLLLWKRHDVRTIGRVVLALILVATLSAFYWLPVLAESRYVGLGHGASQGYRNHLVPLAELISLRPTYDYSLEPGIRVAFPLGWVQAVIPVAVLVLLFRFRQRRWLVLFFAAIALLSTWMLTTASLPAWKVFEPVLAFLQYPWRFQAITALATAILAGVLLQELALTPGWGRAALGGLLLLVTGIWALWALPITPILPALSVQEMWQKDQEFGQVGATWTGEYVPIWVREQRWAISRPVPNPSADNTAGSTNPSALLQGTASLTGVGHTRYDFSLNAPQGASLTLHQFYYPGWQARWQDTTLTAHPRGLLGLVTFELPPGSGPLSLNLALTPAQWWGTLISLLASLALGIALVAQVQIQKAKLPGRLAPRSMWIRTAVLAACCLLLAAVLLGSLALPNGYARATTPVNANLENLVELQASSINGTRYQPGDVVEINLYWMALSELDQDYKAFVHLTDAEVTRQPAQHDGDPGGGFTPTTRWLPGELVPDTQPLTLPDNLPPGRYHIWAGMYEYPTGRNLEVLAAEAPTDGKRVLVADIEVVAP